MGKKSRRNKTTPKAGSAVHQLQGGRQPPQMTTVTSSNPSLDAFCTDKDGVTFTEWEMLFVKLCRGKGPRGAADKLLEILMDEADENENDSFLRQWKSATARDDQALGLGKNDRTNPAKNPCFEPFRLRAFLMYFEIMKEHVTIKGKECDKAFVKQTDRDFLEGLGHHHAAKCDPYFALHRLYLQAGIQSFVDGDEFYAMGPLYRADAILDREIANDDPRTTLPKELIDHLDRLQFTIKFVLRKVKEANPDLYSRAEPLHRLLQNSDWMWITPRTQKESRQFFDAMMYLVKLKLEEAWSGERFAAFCYYVGQMQQNVKGLANKLYLLRQFEYDNDKYGHLLVDVEDRDRKFLKKMSRAASNSDSPINALVAAQSLLTLATITKVLDGQRAESMLVFQRCMEVCDSVPLANEEDSLPCDIHIPIRDGSGMVCGFQTFGNYITFVRSQAERFIKTARFLGKFVGGSLVPGDHCDGCGKSRAEAEQPYLACSGCRITHYCGKECQVNHWRKSHKKECRTEGKFKIGDKVLCLDPTRQKPASIDLEKTDPETPYEVVAEGDEENTWKIKSVYSEESKVFPASKLRLIQPSEARLLLNDGDLSATPEEVRKGVLAAFGISPEGETLKEYYETRSRLE